MKSTVAIYDTHQTALEAVEVLKNKGFPVDQLSLVGQAKIVNDHIKVKSNESRKNFGVFIGSGIGTVAGALSGAGVFAIPGLRFIFDNGIIVGALAGFALGLAFGGIISLITTLGIKNNLMVKYKEHLNKGRFLVIAQGSTDEIEDAKKILCKCGKYLELCVH
jgi:hypothetical protein